MGVGGVRVVGEVDAERVRALDAFVAGHRITEDVFIGLDRAGLAIDDVIAMDEYTIDLVVGLPDGLTLVYDTT